MPLTERFAAAAVDPLTDNPDIKKKHQEYLKEHRRRLRELAYQASDHFLERRPNDYSRRKGEEE